MTSATTMEVRLREYQTLLPAAVAESLAAIRADEPSAEDAFAWVGERRLAFIRKLENREEKRYAACVDVLPVIVAEDFYNRFIAMDAVGSAWMSAHRIEDSFYAKRLIEALLYSAQFNSGANGFPVEEFLAQLRAKNEGG